MKISQFCLGVAVGSVLVAGDLRSRDSDAPPDRLEVPISVDSNKKYSVHVNMSPGPQSQNFTFALSFGTGYTVVAGTACDDCAGVTPYNESASASVKQLSGSRNVSVINSSAGGNLITEDCSLRLSNGSGWFYPNQTIVLANQSDSLISPGHTGIIGLGTNSRDGDFDATVFGGFLSSHPSQTNFSFGMALNQAPDDTQSIASDSDGGVFHWFQPDPSYYDGDVAWKNMVPSNSSSLAADFQVGMDSWTFTTSLGNSSQSGDLVTLIDPMYSTMTFPQRSAALVYAGVFGASVVANTSLTNIWGVPCMSKMNITLTFGDVSFLVDESVLVRNQSGQCFGAIEEWSSPSTTEYLLGSDFLSSVYVIFTVSSATDGMVGFAQRAVKRSSKRLNAASIVGVALGSAAFAIAVVVAAVLIYRARRRRRPTEADKEITPYTPNTPLSGSTSKSPPLSPEITTSYTPPSTGYGYSSGATSNRSDSPSHGAPDHPPPYSGQGSGLMQVVERRGQEEMPAVHIGPPPGGKRIRNISSTVAGPN
ncbi:aspartic peptidase domain-containing protein [Armillaria novae-zelandiae]|uniref:Aspartic peptidase domain-containing protein n=1 Tax=Armillaria novae-zelandiae TaxID=153914 RepID=A0AA39P072_9AGAR|nr:aspartic peptidase domain-containing protein [Armillaria novae-zelandiae]